MSDDANSSEPTSAKTPANGKAHPAKSESEFLARQAGDARAAIDATVHRMGESLKNAPDLKAWTREYPWASVGAAVAVGFLAGTMMVPRHKRVADPNEILARVLSDGEVNIRLRELADSKQDQKPRLLSSLLATLGRLLFGALQSTIVAAITAPLAAQQAADNAQSPEPQPEAD